jgi:hypothetical protein
VQVLSLRHAAHIHGPHRAHPSIHLDLHSHLLLHKRADHLLLLRIRLPKVYRMYRMRNLLLVERWDT